MNEVFHGNNLPIRKIGHLIQNSITKHHKISIYNDKIMGHNDIVNRYNNNNNRKAVWW